MYAFKDDWRCDQYRWVNNGVTGLPKREPIVKKHYFQLDTLQGSSKDFTRSAYTLYGNNTKVRINYNNVFLVNKINDNV